MLELLVFTAAWVVGIWCHPSFVSCCNCCLEQHNDVLILEEANADFLVAPSELLQPLQTIKHLDSTDSMDLPKAVMIDNDYCFALHSSCLPDDIEIVTTMNVATVARI